MTTINDAYVNAILADATYALGDGVRNGTTGPVLKTLLSTRMTDTVARYISDNFTVVTHIDTSDVLGSGFDATVWRRNDGKIYVSMTGTENLQDFITDAQLALTGNAGSQVVAMVNWWLKISTPVGQMARQVEVDQSGGVPFLVGVAIVPGTGLVTATELANGVEVNGHSLGGYLASAFTRLFGVQANVLHTATFNSAGFALGSETAFQKYESFLGAGYGLGRFPGSTEQTRNEQTNFFAMNGINMTTNSFWFNQVGQRVELFNESSALQVPNHFMSPITNSLALANAISQLDVDVTFDRINRLFEAGGNSMSRSLEGILDGLRRMMVGNDAIPTPVDSDGARATYHQNLAELTNTAAFLSLIGEVRVELSNNISASEARSEFSAFVALDALSPVILCGTDSTAWSFIGRELRAVRGDLYSLWDADRNLTDVERAEGRANITDQWLTDRTAMLNLLVQRNTADTVNISSTSSSNGVATTYRDVTTSGVSGAGHAKRGYCDSPQSRRAYALVA